MEIRLESAHFENFKGLKNVSVNFSDKTFICGQNASGKTSIFDGVTWILFDKDSQFNSKFEVRELDASGNKVHFTEIIGTIVLLADGQRYEITKTQSEKWVKKRGQQSQEFSGNQNAYQVNGFPKSEKEYKAFISELIGEDIFKMITSPMAFTSLDWKAQRKILMSLLDDISDDEVRKSVENFDLIAADIAVASPDDCKSKYGKSKKLLSDKLDQLPIRIDELEKQKVEVDVDSLTAERDKLTEVIDKTEEFIRQNPIPDESDYRKEIARLEADLNRLSREANAGLTERKAKVSAEVSALESERYKAQMALDKCKTNLADFNDELQRIDTEYRASWAKYEEIKAETFPADKEVCPTCGQALPDKQRTELRQKWEENKQKRMHDINTAAGNMIRASKSVKESIRVATEKMQKANRTAVDIEDRLESKQAELAALNSTKAVDASESDEFKAIASRIPEIAEQMKQIDIKRAERSNLVADLYQYKRDRDSIIEQLSDVRQNERIDSQIADYTQELNDVRIRVANMERLLDVLGEYVKFLAQKINEQFSGLTFKLFENQINGGIRECCEISYDGIPYSSLNSGHRIVVGLQIIRALQEIYGHKAFIFVDNAETVNDKNVPDMDCQMVFLKVTDDKKLVIS